MKGRPIGLQEFQRIIGKAAFESGTSEKKSRSEATVESMKSRAEERRRRRGEKMKSDGLQVVDDRSKTQSEIMEKFADQFRKDGLDPRFPLKDDASSREPEIETSPDPEVHQSEGGVSGPSSEVGSPEP